MWLRRLALALLLVVAGMAASPLSAQAPAGPAGPAPAAPGIPPEQVQDLLRTLKDPAARDKLIATLEALAAVQRREPAAPSGPVAEAVSGLRAAFNRLAGDVVSTAEFVVDLPRLWQWLRDAATVPTRRAALLGLAEALVLVLAAGLVAEAITKRLLARPRMRLETAAPVPTGARIVVLLACVLLALLPILAFAAAACGVIPWLQLGHAVQGALIELIIASVAVRAIIAAARLLLISDPPRLRVLPLSPETAAYVFVWTRRLTGLVVLGWFIPHALLRIGLPYGAFATLLRLVGLATTALVVVIILQNRSQVAMALRGSPPAAGSHSAFRSARARLGDVWHVLAIAYVVGLFVVWALNVRNGFGFVFGATVITVAAVIAARLLGTLAERGIDRAFRVSDELALRLPGLEARANRYVPVLRAGVQALIAAIAAIVVLQAWGIHAYAALTSSTGSLIVGMLVRVGVILIVAAIGWELFAAFIERSLLRTDAAGRPLAERSARARTLLPLLRTTVAVVLLAMVGLALLSEIGVDIAPLLAGAGILGVAIGFGSQSLVRDIITGIFILVEDTVAVGEVVKLGDHRGVVEAMSLRSIRLRDLNGTVHTIPFSAVTSVQNLTRNFSYRVFDIGVAYREDTDRVSEVIQRVADEMIAEPHWHAMIIPPFEILGVETLADSAVNIRARFKTSPGKQWAVGREFNRRIKKAFDAEGIEMPFPHRTIYFGVDREGNAPAAHLKLERAGRAPAPEAPPAEHPAAPPAERSRTPPEEFPPAEEAEPASGGG